MADAGNRLAENARITLKAACRLKAGESLLLCTRRSDHRYAPSDEVARTVAALEQAALELGARPVVLDLTSYWSSGQYQQGAVLPSVRAAMESADVVLNTMDDVSFSKLIGRQDNDDEFLTSERRWLFLMHKGMDRWKIDETTVASIRPRTMKLIELLDAGCDVQITSPAGTDFHFQLTDNYKATAILGIVPLYGEVAVAPTQGTEWGKIVVDGPSQRGVRRADELDRPPLRIDVEGGRAVYWTGDPEQVARLETFLAVGDPKPYTIDEVGIPTSRAMDNDWAWWRDGTHHLERIHIALGNNVHREDHVHGAQHMDLEICRPTLILDGVTLIDDAKFVGPLAG